MTAPNTESTEGTIGGAPAIPFEQLPELEQQATLCTLALNEKDGLLDGSQVAWGGTPRTVDEQKALLAANHDKAVAIMTAVLASPKGRDVLPIAWPPAPVAPPIAPPQIVPATQTPEQLAAIAHLGPAIVGADVHAAAQAQQAATPGVMLTPAEHAASKSLADRIEAHIPDVVKLEWATLRALLRHL